MDHLLQRSLAVRKGIPRVADPDDKTVYALSLFAFRWGISAQPCTRMEFCSVAKYGKPTATMDEKPGNVRPNSTEQKEQLGRK